MPTSPARASAGRSSRAVTESQRTDPHTRPTRSFIWGNRPTTVFPFMPEAPDPATHEPSAPRTPVRLPSDRDHTGRDFGARELELLGEVIASGKLNATGGAMTQRFEQVFAERVGRKRAIACASGSAAMHAAVGALGLQPGDEVVTTPITDMGAILGIVYERGRPVFADVDPTTGNVTAETLAACIGERTRALVVTHLFGAMARMRPILELAKRHGLVVIEDAAQAFDAFDADGHRAGASGAHLSCFSCQQGKHMTAGEGGLVVGDDERLLDEVDRFINKGWGYGDAAPDHDRPGLNYRITELQSAVLVAQLEKLDGVIARRRARAEELRALLADIPGLSLPENPAPHGAHSWWRFALRIDPAVVPGGPDAVAQGLRAFGIGSAPRYVRKPAFACGIFQHPERHGFSAHLSEDGACWRAAGDGRVSHPGVHEALERLLVLPWNEHYAADDVQALAEAIRATIARLTGRPATAATLEAPTPAAATPEAGAAPSAPPSRR
jgi:perosamine synthetase